ncbi:MAG: hypothetical protein ACFB15_20990 [Cyclobacteriaceae bacterium]
MSRFLLFLFSALLIEGCQEDEIEPESFVEGALNDEPWLGEVFQVFLDEQGSLVVNASRPSTQENVEIEQATFYIPVFQ